MMSQEQIILIQKYLLDRGIYTKELRDDLLDHICCVVEENISLGVDFQKALQIAVHAVLPEKVNTIQEDLDYLFTIKRKTMFRKTAYTSGYFSLMLIACGILFIPFFQKSTSVDKTLAELAGVSISKSPELMNLANLAQSFSQPTISEIVLLIGFALFLITVVPFWFYKGYQNSMLKLQNSN